MHWLFPVDDSRNPLPPVALLGAVAQQSGGQTHNDGEGVGAVNPVKNQQINIRSDEMEKGKYHLLLHNPKGQQIMNRVIDHPGGSFNQIIYLSKTLQSGMYYLQIANEKEKYSQMVLLE